MGITSSKSDTNANALSNMLRQYRTIAEKSSDHVTVLENIYNPGLLVEMRHLKYAREDQLQERLNFYEKVKTIIHPSLLRVVALSKSKMEQFCSSTYQLTILIEKPAQTLPEYLEQRGPIDFTENELWFMLDCLVSAQAQLQRLYRPTKSLSFDEILMCHIMQNQQNAGQIWKIAPQELDFDDYHHISLYERFKQNLSNPQTQYHLYISPEEVSALKQKAPVPPGDPYKQSVFNLGMIMLHLAQGEACDHMYSMETLEFNKDHLSERVKELQDRFSQSLSSALSQMLIFDADIRASYIEMDQFLNSVPDLKGKRVSEKSAQYQATALVHQTTAKAPVKLAGSSKSASPINQLAYPDPQYQSLTGPQIQGIVQARSGPNPQQVFQETRVKQMLVSTPLPLQSEYIAPAKSTNNYDLDEPITVTEAYQNGSRYTGDKVNGQRHGKGRMDFAEGGFYEGQWRNNTMNGKGQLYYDNGQKAYEGDFRDGKFHNFGHLFNKWPSKDTKPFDFKNFKFLGDNWVRYEGDFQEDKKHGFGLLHLTNGEKFTGSFVEDQVHGYGAFTKADGSTVNGYWDYSILNRLF